MDFMNDPEFAKMLEEFERELENLSPEERKQFDEMVDEFARVIQEMPEEEFNQLLQDINADFEMADEAHIGDAAPREAQIAPIVQLAVPDEIKKLAETLQNIRTYLSLFLVKVQIAPEFSLQIDKWIHQGKIENTPNEYTWDRCNYDIEKCLALISNLLETDKHMNPIFLFEIHKDQALEDMLHALAEFLTIVPSINIVEFGFKQEKETNSLVREVISHLCDAFFTQDIIAKLDLIFKAHQKEIEPKPGESGKIRGELAPFQAPSAAEPPYRHDLYEEPMEYDFYDENEYGNYYPSYSPDRRYGGSGDLQKSAESAESKKGTPEKKQSEAQYSSGRGKQKKEEEKTVKSELNNLQKQLPEIVSLTRTAHFEQFEKYLKNNEIRFTMQNTLGNAEELIKKTKEATKTANTLVSLINEEKQPEKIIQDVQNKIEKDLDEINVFNEKLSALVSEQASYSPEKRFGHFGDLEVLETIKKTDAKKAKELETNQEQFVSITQLDKNFNELLATLQPFVKEEEAEEAEEEPEEIKTETPEEVEEPTKLLPEEPEITQIAEEIQEPQEE